VDINQAGGEADENEIPNTQLLQGYAQHPNIATEIEKPELDRIGQKCTREYQIDKTSRSDWLTGIKAATKLAKQTVEEKTYPWPKAANTKYPLLTVAAIQFQARAYPALVTGDIAKCKINGFDQDGKKAARATRVSKTMQWQLLEQMEEWEEETDKLLTILPITGMVFRKTYYSPLFQRPVSEMVLAEHMIFNYKAKSFETCPRKTQEFNLYPHELTERINSGLYLDQEYHTNKGEDDDAPIEFIEQHRLLDLDEDGYPEPYIVTVHVETTQVCRIRARFEESGVHLADDDSVSKIVPVEYFTKYSFLPNPDGSAHDVGFGELLGPLNETINSTANRILDGGTLANTSGGLIGKGIRMRGGALRFRPGEFKPVTVTAGKIADNVYQFKYPGPSAVLFEMLGFLVDAGRDIASTKDILTGEQKIDLPATTTLALIEQGLKTFTAIFKRVHRSFKGELKKIYKINGDYFPPKLYVTFLDAQEPEEVLLGDFQDGDLDIVPVSDPSMVTDMQKMAKAEALLKFAEDPAFNSQVIKRRYLEALGIEDIDDIMSDGSAQREQAQQQLMMALKQMDNEEREIDAKWIKAVTDAMLNVAKAESQEAGTQLSQYQNVMENLFREAELRDKRTGVESMGSAPGNPGVQAVP
jgi:chaperonin GroES